MDVETQELQASAQAKPLQRQRRDPEHAATRHVGDLEVDEGDGTARLLFHIQENGAGIKAVVEPAQRMQVAEAVDLDSCLRQQEIAIFGGIDRLREQHGRPRRIDVAGVVVESERQLHPPGADSEPVAPVIIEIVPIENRAIIAERPELAAEQLQAKPQPIGRRQGEIEPHFGKLEAAARGLGEVIVRRAEQISLADETVELQVREIPRQSESCRRDVQGN